MSELKSYKMVDEDFCDNALCVVPSDVYLKSEVDEVIRRQKYKRCLNMAKWCFTRSNFFFVVGRSEGGRFAEERFRRSNLYSKWQKRWLKIAEQFKED